MIEPEWIFKTIDDKAVNEVAEEFSLPSTIAKVMSLRGIKSRTDSRAFFYPDQRNLHNPFDMKDMKKSVDRILESISYKKTVLIFGDYDVDGTSSAAFLTLFLKSIGLEAHYYIPSREKEGYGISKQGIDYAIYIGADIFISCDCGINAFDKIDYANEKNLDVIITDHHKPADKLPNAFSIINPNRYDCSYPFKGLCGASVVFKLALAICELGRFDFALAWVHSDIVTLGISADLVPIKDENRIIVHHGIEQMKKETNLGITALLKTGGLIDKTLTVGRLVFWLAPKINAAGRLGDASRAVKLLTTQNPVLARQIAEELEVENNRRKDITLQITNDAINMVEATCDLSKENAIILGHKSWHPGVIGIVASRIKETYARPTIIMSFDNNEGKASCRSISGFDMVDALDQCSDLLIGYGGHPIAAGLSISSNNYEIFKKKIISLANKQISPDQLIPSIYIDCELNLNELNTRMINFLNAMEPYGPGNSRPIFVSKNLSIDGIPKLLGKDKNTLKFNVKQNQTHFESIGFNMAEHYEKLIQNSPVDIAYVIGENFWNGKKTIQLELKDIKLSNNYA